MQSVDPCETCIADCGEHHLFEEPSCPSGGETPGFSNAITTHVEEFGGMVAFISDVCVPS